MYVWVQAVCLVLPLLQRERGIGSTANLGNNAVFDSNRTEVLRLLLILLSQQIYAPSGSLFTKPSVFSLYIVKKIPRRDVLTILCSLLNTAMNSSAPEKVTIGTIAGKLPYNHLVFKGEDPRMNLITISMQVLCVLLDFQSGDARDQIIDGQNLSPSAKTNTFRYFIMKLVGWFLWLVLTTDLFLKHRAQDFEYLFNGIINVMEQQTEIVKYILPGAKKSLPYVTETSELARFQEYYRVSTCLQSSYSGN